MKYFSFDPDGFVAFHETAEFAMVTAEKALAIQLDRVVLKRADVTRICWGEVRERVAETVPASGDDEAVYDLRPVAGEQPAPRNLAEWWASLSDEQRRGWARFAQGRRRVCVEHGCGEPAGTPWTPAWCAKHDGERQARISQNLGSFAEGKP